MVNISAPEWRKIQTVNQKNLKAVPSGGVIEYVYLRPLLFVGKHTDPAAKQVIAELPKSGAVSKGTIEVLRAAIINKGELKATPPKADRAEFEKALREISKKKVFYV